VPATDLLAFPRHGNQIKGFHSGEFRGDISLAMKSRQLFHSEFCVRFSSMGFVHNFEHTNH